jgi:hypothetical protein
VRLGLVGGFTLLAAGLGWAGADDRALPRVVSVSVGVAERATGFTAGPGRVVTVAHALEGEHRAAVVVTVAHALEGEHRAAVAAGGAHGRGARTLARDHRSDLAVLAVPGLRGPELEQSAPDEGAWVTVLLSRDGRTIARPARVRRRIVAHVRSPGTARAERRPALELQARLGAGDSGAPVISEDGGLAGVVFARSTARAHTAYAVEAAAVERLLRRAPRP